MEKIFVRLPAAAALTAFTLTLLAPLPGHADPYNYCAVQGGNGGSTNCGFRTYDQRMQQVRGMGGWCQPNQFYTGPDKDEAPLSKRK